MSLKNILNNTFYTDKSVSFNKINAVTVKQNLFDRITGMYSIDIVNIGMGNDKKDKPYFHLRCSERRMKCVMAELLLEYQNVLELQLIKQPFKKIVLSLIYILIVTGIMTLIGIIAGMFAIGLYPTFNIIRDFVCEENIQWKVVLMIVLITILVGLYKIIEYNNRKIAFSKDIIAFKYGVFCIETVYIKVNKVQYIDFHQNFIAKLLGISKGRVSILAKKKYNRFSLPYMTLEQQNELEELVKLSKGY